MVSLHCMCTVSNKLLIACSWFFLVGLTASACGPSVCGLVFVTCPICIMATYDIGKSDLACLAHSSSILDYKPNGMFLYNIRIKLGLALDSKLTYLYASEIGLIVI